MDGFSLRAYVPRLVATWLDDAPDLRHRVIDGTLASADISGFTKLSERLAGDGKVGGENLTFALNEVFTLLIDEAVALGGDVLKFGGDAVLILFDGPDHARRAIAASARMQAAIESERARDAAAGIALRMSVGAHTGPIDLFLVGDEHRELVVAGPGATATARLEDDAEAGMVLVDAPCAEGLGDLFDTVVDATATAERDDGGVVIDRARALEMPVDAVAPEPSPEPTGRALAPNLRNQVEAIEQIGGEHRRATVGFVRFQGIDDRVAAGDIDAVVADLETLLRRTSEFADRYSATLLYSDIYFDGGKFLMTAGAPTSSGHDEESMLRTVLDTLAVETQLELRAGVNAGPLFAGFLGSPERRTFTVMGDDVNLAARLMQHAKPGTLLATDELIETAGSGFGSAPVEPFQVKGKTDPIRAGEVLLERGRGGDEIDPDREVPFVGRTELLAELVRLRADAIDGSGSAVVLSGGSGSGKSRLVQELLNTPIDVPETDVRAIRLTCYPYDELDAYATGQQLMRSLLGLEHDASAGDTGEALAAHVAEVAPHLAPWLPLLAVFAGATVEATPEVDAVDASFRRDRLHNVVLDYLDIALPDSAVLVVEDSHWLDDEMTAFITWMASLVLADRPWLVALTTRTPVTEIDLVGRTIALPPLRGDEARELARLKAAMSGVGASAAGGYVELADDVIDAVAARSGGNPLFLLALAENAVVGVDADVDALPESVETLLTTRIDQLPAALRLQLRRAAVIGMDFSDELLRAVGIDAIVPWGPASDFVQLARGGSMRFRQALFRDVAYEGLPYRHRREVHGALADHLITDDTDDTEQLAPISLHFHLAERHADAFEWSLAAAEDAAAKYANGSAADLYARALANATILHERGEALPVAAVVDAADAHGRVLQLAGRGEEADVALGHAMRLLDERWSAEDTVRRADLRRRRAVLRQNLGEPDAAMRGLEEVLEMLADETGDDAAEVRANTLLECARVRFFQTRFAEAIEFGEQAVTTSGLIDAKETFARANLTLHIAHVSMGSSDAAQYRDVALPIFEATGDLVGQGNMLNNLGIEAFYAGAWDDAADCYERSRQARERCGDVIGAATSANNLAEILSDQGHFGDAADLFDDALRAFTSSGFAVGIALATSNLGRVAARTGQAERAERLLADAEQRFRDLGADDMAVDTGVRLAEAAVFGHDAADADRRARDVLDLEPAPLAAVIAHRVVGLAAATRSDLSAALDALQASSSLAVHEGLDFERAVTELIAAELRARPVSGDVAATARRLGLVNTPEVQLVQGVRASIAMGAVDGDEQELATDDRRLVALANSELLASVDPATIRELALRATTREVPAGGVLIRQGDLSDGIFLVMRGRFDVSAVRPGSGVATIGDAGRGEWIGEMAMLSDERRNATVTARRDSEVLELSAAALIAVIGSHPHVLRGITSKLVQRLLSGRGERRSASAIPTVGCVALDDTAAVDAVVDDLTDAMAGGALATVVLDAAQVDTAAIRRAETQGDAVFVTARRHARADGGDAARLAAATTDVLLLVVDGERADGSTRLGGDMLAMMGHGALDVVVAGSTAELADWAALPGVRRVHRCVPGDAAAAERICRGARGLETVAVLSGGGAHACAHLGASEGWQSAGRQVDAIVGSGAGAIVGAAIASGLSTAEALERCAPLLVPSIAGRDLRLPRLSLTSGSKLSDGLRAVFGDRRIEDLDIDFVAVATDLSSGVGVSIDHGELWRAVRASAGTPGVVPPVRFGDAVLVDGGIADPFPVSRARHRYPNATVIGVDVMATTGFTAAQLDAAGLPDAEAEVVTPLRRTLARAFAARSSRRGQRLTLASTMQRLAQVRHDDVVGDRDRGDIAVRPPIEGFGMHEIDRADELVRLGRSATREAIETHAIVGGA